MTATPPADFFERVRLGGRPAPHPAATVIAGQARFTILTSRLIRLEYRPDGRWEDRATFAFPSRYADPPPFTATEDGAALLIDTGDLQLRYTPGAPFDAATLSIGFALNGAAQTWRPGAADAANLRGTRRTLDGTHTDEALEPGLVSRSGWALFDDSTATVLDEQGWVTARTATGQDWYFFGYGHDYAAALSDYTRFGGAVPLIPRYVLGAWWSRFWSYSDADLRALVADFQAHDLPLDVLVLDMDWHTTDSWTGYSWNRKLFPDPAGFLAWAHEQGLRTTLNLHPAEGVQNFEEQYAEFAAALGADSSAGAAVPFRITDRAFAQQYFERLHHPLEDQGVDFWWMDWQQGQGCELPGLDPLIWINHLHFHDAARRGTRPLLYSRWGGLGNHRYPIGFSGDTLAVWPALQFLPHFTASAANVGFGWWSHDIGGHFGATEPELFARWVQYGALSPCLRLHATKDPLAERRPWLFPAPVFAAARDAFRLRYQLLPYLYTMARRTTDIGLALCRPTYYSYPEDDAAYIARHQYFLGDDLLAAPILTPADPATGLASAVVWVPPGTWTDWTTHEQWTGPRWVQISGGLDRVPLLVRAGAVVPVAPVGRTTADLPTDHLTLRIFPGDGSGQVYEDDATTVAYTAGEFEWTTVHHHAPSATERVITIAPVVGLCAALPRQRGYTLELVASAAPSAVTVNDAPHRDWSYDAATATTTITLPALPKSAAITVGLALAASSAVAAPTPVSPPLAQLFSYVAPEDAQSQFAHVLIAPADRVVSGTVTWQVSDHQGERTATFALDAVSADTLLASPFRWDGAVQTARWSVVADLAANGQPLGLTYHSAPLFPAIPRWQIVVYDQAAAPLGVDELQHGGALAPLAWQRYEQALGNFRSLVDPYTVILHEEHRSALQRGAPLAAFAVVTVHSPDERQVVIECGSACPMQLWLNGVNAAPDLEVIEGSPFSAFLRPRRTAPLTLQPGANSLIVQVAWIDELSWWSFKFGVAVESIDGTPMPDVTYALPE